MKVFLDRRPAANQPKDAPAPNRYSWLLRVRPAFLGSCMKVLLGVHRLPVRAASGVFFVDPASNFGDALIRAGMYEPEMEEQLRSNLTVGSVFVDVGANEGYFSVIASRLVGEAGRVIAIEPQNRLQQVIQTNLRVNKCTNVTVVHGAVGSVEGPITIHLMPSTNTGATSAIRRTRYRLPKQTTPCYLLKSLFGSNAVEFCDLMKVDVEGYEHAVLLGAEELLDAGRIHAIALEYHPTILSALGQSSAEIHRWLVDKSYELVAGAATTLYVHSSPAPLPAHQSRDNEGL